MRYYNKNNPLRFLKLFSVLLCSNFLFSQDVPELDENFLRSLPSDIRTDVLTKMNEDVVQNDVKIDPCGPKSAPRGPAGAPDFAKPHRNVDFS